MHSVRWQVRRSWAQTIAHSVRPMRLGFTSMNTPDDPRPDVLASEVESRGYDSLWIGEHSHIPVARQTPYPAGGEMPEAYRWMMDPFLSLLLAATSTETLLLGTHVALP